MDTAIVLLVVDWVLVALATGLSFFSFPSGKGSDRPSPQAEWHGWVPNLVALEPYIASVACIWAIVANLAITVFLPPYSDLGGSAYMGNPVILQSIFLLAMSIAAVVLTWHPFNTKGWDREPAGPALTVLTLNCRYGKADADAIVKTVRTGHVDALCLEEVDDGLLRRLEKAGIADILPYRVTGQKGTEDNGGTNVVFTKDRPVAQVRASLDLKASDVPAVVIPWQGGPRVQDGAKTSARPDITGTTGQTSADSSITGTRSDADADQNPALVTIAVAHTKSPQRGVRDWGYGVSHLANPALDPAIRKACAATGPTATGTSPAAQASPATSDGQSSDTGARTATPPAVTPDPALAVLAGDLNASASHRSLRSALGADRKLTDSSDDLSHRRTFPAHWALVPPMLELDHVLHGPGLIARSSRTVRIPGTDHLGLLVTLEKI